MTYDNPVFLEQKKRRKETIDDSGFVKQYKLDEPQSDTNSLIENDEEDNEEDITEEEIVEVEDDSVFNDDILAMIEDVTIIDEEFDDAENNLNEQEETPSINFKFGDGKSVSVRNRLEMGLENESEDKPTLKLNFKPKQNSDNTEPPKLKFNLKK